MSAELSFLSVCSGIEAASVAWHPLGWTAFAFSEIEPFPSAVLAHHYGSNLPNELWKVSNGVPNLGDMNNFREWPDANIDVLVGGTPCQSFSVAGLRKGLADPRGNLCLTYLAIADKYRPEWIVWENVPGVLSSSEGRDFGAFIGGLAELGYHASWRVLDAQYVRVDGFGRAVPQRRRRVFVVGHLGDWRRAAAVLFERESLSWDSAPRRKAGEGIAPTISARTKGCGGLGTDFDCDGGLLAFGGNNTLGPIDAATARNAHGGRLDFDSETFIAFSCKDHGADAGDIAPTLHSMGHDGSHANAGGNGGRAGIGIGAILSGWAVRRLTELECERLQGFEDGYTDVPYRGKKAAGGPRYKALGNSMAVNAMRWLGTRIAMVHSLANPEASPS